MIDIEHKILKFGYGDIEIGSYSVGLKFRGIKPPVEVGSVLSDKFISEHNIEPMTTWMYLRFKSLQELLNFEQLLNQVDVKFTSFTYAGITFDFTNYNKKSINAVLNHLGFVRQNLLYVVAC